MAEAQFRFSPRPNRAHEIRWHSWGPEAFEEARAAEKPILLSISAIWCHWCHVMDETTYSDPALIARINEAFVPVRVDNDQRPDINQRYNMGGWPTTAFLTPAGEIITGGTFFPQDQMGAVLDQVLDYWRQHKDEIKDQLTPPQPPPLDTGRTEPDNQVVAGIVESIRQQFDRAYGGIGLAPKFPLPEVWELCLTYFTATGDGWAAGMAVRTLDAMAGSSLFDGVAGGFFRYSTTREWSAPHYEKLLEDNARLARLYLRAFQILGDDYYRQVADAVLAWANRTLMNPRGLWGGSQDADEEYYRLPPEERQRRPAPAVDPVVHTNWNALMISAQLLAAVLINPQTYAAVALTALEGLWDLMWDPQEETLYHFYTDRPMLPGLLVDVVDLSQALLDAYEFTGDAEHLHRVRQLLAYADRHLRDPEGVGYFDQIERPQAQGRLRHRQKLVSENAGLGLVLHRLGSITEDEELMDRAEALIAAFSPAAQQQGAFAAAWALAADRTAAPPLTATVVESPTRSGRELRQAAFGIFDRNRALRTLATDDPAFAASGFPDLPMPALYLCRGSACAQPVTSPEGILGALEQLAGMAAAPQVREG
ncbi:Thymidylate kinase [Candidatus Hydrogenisulfobacillus filiaventi]|uniref:Thymidylate kinase n=1 Tax=Candidatus Hydrogenisulfobacillus filiaventi TaxID=2707344 RepID=A0A6F8ZI90_9FIRM|nr:DUF255 domain-containing protein [Bacillota bacterium]CAB1129662.1 Thymidylate kinase [Candidatus Hydrogenisulfobacillus filiaventi]